LLDGRLENASPSWVSEDWRFYYAAGAAAERVLLGNYRDSGSLGDKQDHRDRGGTDFESDVLRVAQFCHFTKALLESIALPLEKSKNLCWWAGDHEEIFSGVPCGCARHRQARKK
jgi:hypothetical protein